MVYQAQGVDRYLKEAARLLELATRADYSRARLDMVQLISLENTTLEILQSVANEPYRNIKDEMKKHPVGYLLKHFFIFFGMLCKAIGTGLSGHVFLR